MKRLKIKFEDFIVELKQDVDEFESYWKENHKADPIGFPMEFGKDNEGMWFEQFIAFFEIRNDE